MHFNELIFTWVLFLNLALVVGCSPGADKKLEEVLDNSQYGAASCAYRFDEGAAASSLSYSDVRSTFFDKRVDFSLLNPVLPASGAETIRFAELTNVRYFKTTFRDTKNCEFVQSLPVAPSDLAAKLASVDKSGNILGVYFGARTPDLPSVQNQAAILVKRDVNKWVLVHELMHHLYQLQRDSDKGIATVDIKTRFLALLKEYENSEKSLRYTSPADRPAKLKATVAKLVELNNAAFDFLREYLLEEMAIENVLGDKFEKNELKYVVEGQRFNGAAYTIESAKTAQTGFISSLTEEIGNFKMLYYDMTTEDRQALEQILQTYRAMNREISDLKSKAQEYLRSKGYHKDLRGVRGASPVPLKPACSHQQGVDEVLEVLKRRNR